jgi:hypothetical protein
MRYSKLSLAIGLLCCSVGCKRPYSITLQPTIEEAPALPSRIQAADPGTSKQFTKGVYDLEDNSYRWAAPKFSVMLGTPPSAMKKGAWLVLDFNLPDVSIHTLKNMTVTAKIGDVALPPETFYSPGQHQYRHEVSASAFTHEVTPVDFTTDKFLQPPNDRRSLAFLVTAVALESK